MTKKLLMALMGAAIFSVSAFAQYGSLSHREVKDLVKDTHKLAKHFEDDFDSALGDTIVDETRLEKNYNNRADELEDQLNKAKSNVGDREDFREHIDKALQAAFDVNKMMADTRFPELLERDWTLIRSRLNTLAGLAGVKPLSTD